MGSQLEKMLDNLIMQAVLDGDEEREDYGPATNSIRSAIIERYAGTVYVAMINDRHDDPQPYVFSTPEAAIAYAGAQAKRSANRPEDFDESETPDGWLYYATYSVEGDCVWVTSRGIDEQSE